MRIIIIYLILIFQGCLFSQETQPYEMYTLHFDIDNYFKDAQRAFDSEGIITQKRAYHALTISVYGTMCADEFKKTGDSIYYYRVIDQYKYFSDKSKLVYFDDSTAVGLPYRMDYHGMKAPWYSGLTQGMATSFLLRYYELTNDESALELSKKIVRQMIKPESNGGTIGATKEGCTWIEEYPNTKRSKSVLNGFVNGLVGLKEFLGYFPDDTIVKAIHDECYESLFETLEYYDKPEWTSYNRNGGKISNFYIRLQIQQFDHLYQIYNDDRLRLQMKLWSKFALNKIDKAGKFYKKRNYQFSQQVKSDQNEYLYSDSVNFMKALTLFHFDSKNKSSSKTIVAKLPIETNYAKIKLKHKFKKRYSVDYFLKDQLIETVNHKNSDTFVYISDVAFDKVKIHLSKRFKNDTLPVSMSYYSYKEQTMPLFGLIKDLEIKELDGDKRYLIESEKKNVSNAVVFYRYSKDKKHLKTQIFNIKNTFEISDVFIPESTGSYEFFISYDITQPYSYIKDIEFIEINN